jgi:hypothetical protein
MAQIKARTSGAWASVGAASATAVRQLGQRRYQFKLTLLQTTPMLTGPGSLGNTIYWFEPMRVDNILGSNAIAAPDGLPAKYYSWESTDHDQSYGAGTALGGIFLRTAQSPTGPWSNRTLLFQDTSGGAVECETPSVVYMADDPNGRPFYCYYQVDMGTFQCTRLKSSADGRTGWVQEPIRNVLGPSADWTNNRLRVSTNWELGIEHTGYFNPFAHGRRMIAFGRTNGTLPDSFGMYHSYDGIDWQLDARPIRYNVKASGAFDLFVAPTQLRPFLWNGQSYTLTTLANRITPVVRTPVVVPLASNFRNVIGPALPILTPTQAWEDTTLVRHITPYGDGSKVYVYITYGGPSLTSNTGVYELTEAG